MSKDIKVRHIRDYRNYERVMTLVTRKEDGKVSYGFSVNKPTEWVNYTSGKNFRSKERVKGDQFSRRKGREIAMARLDNPRTVQTVPVSVDVHPYREVLAHIVSTQTGVVKRIAEIELEDFDMLQDYKDAMKEYEQSLLSEQN